MKQDLLLIPFGISIQIIFLLKRELLTDAIFKKWIWVYSSILFIIGFVIGKTYIQEIKTLPILMMPLISYLVFVILLKIYKSIYNEEPVDTFHSMDLKLMKSGIFNAIFWIMGTMIPTIIILVLIKYIN